MDKRLTNRWSSKKTKKNDLHKRQTKLSSLKTNKIVLIKEEKCSHKRQTNRWSSKKTNKIVLIKDKQNYLHKRPTKQKS